MNSDVGGSTKPKSIELRIHTLLVSANYMQYKTYRNTKSRYETLFTTVNYISFELQLTPESNYRRVLPYKQGQSYLQ